MKSPENKIKTLQFPWDQKAGQLFRTEKADFSEKQNFESYLDWLEEFKPGAEELCRTKTFDKPFTLNN
jgi:hypothetical protein